MQKGRHTGAPQRLDRSYSRAREDKGTLMGRILQKFAGPTTEANLLTRRANLPSRSTPLALPGGFLVSARSPHTLGRRPETASSSPTESCLALFGRTGKGAYRANTASVSGFHWHRLSRFNSVAAGVPLRFSIEKRPEFHHCLCHRLRDYRSAHRLA